MAVTLKNKNIELEIQFPLEDYLASRFDWTGKIVQLKFQKIVISGNEKSHVGEVHEFGRGFYNEFGIDSALGFQEARVGEWFHKIGVGLLKKDGDQYDFSKLYEIKPAEFNTAVNRDRVLMQCKSPRVNGYSYALRKEIRLLRNGFFIQYRLENTGIKKIETEEYTHNFLALTEQPIKENYRLTFPFQMRSDNFEERVNPSDKVTINGREVQFKGSPKEAFFFSNLSGSVAENASWELSNVKNKIKISETGSFKTQKVNLWGCEHVISPELFYKIELNPGESAEWSRTYNISRFD